MTDAHATSKHILEHLYARKQATIEQLEAAIIYSQSFIKAYEDGIDQIYHELHGRRMSKK